MGLKPFPLHNDCFALPGRGKRVPVEAALAHLRPHPADAKALRDGFAVGTGRHRLPPATGQAETGKPFVGQVPVGPAVKVLVGAPLSAGADRVIVWSRADAGQVFGFSGNMMVAFVATKILAHPALSLLAGGKWLEPLGLQVPPGCNKRKPAGWRDFLRARLARNGVLKIFPQVDFARVFSLSWATGLWEIPAHRRERAPGDLVRYLPYVISGSKWNL